MKGLQIVVALFFAVSLGLLPMQGQAATGDISTVLGGGVAGTNLILPNGVAVDSIGNIYVADTGNHQILKLAAGTGAVSRVAGTRTAGFSGDDGLATAAALSGPTAVAVGAGNLYIADTANRRVRKVTLATGIITTVAGNGTRDSTGDGGPATSATLKVCQGVAVDGAGNLYIADFFGVGIRKVDAETGIITTLASSIPAPSGVAVDSAGNLFAVANGTHRVWKVAAESGAASVVAGNGTAGSVGDNGQATAANLNQPFAVAVDSFGNLYISELVANRIRKVDAETGIISTIAGKGTAGFTGDGGPATNATFKSPQGVALDSQGNLYVADTGNNRIRKFLPKNPPVVTAAPAGGTYSSAQKVVLTASRTATIYYTTDGSVPNSTTSPRIDTTGQVNIPVSTTLNYFAVDLEEISSSVRTQEYNLVAGAPTEVAAIAGIGQATVSFTPPSFDGGSSIIYYSVTSTPPGVSATVLTSPVTVTGLTGGTSYSFQVVAITNNGAGATSTSNSVTPEAPAYTLTLNFAGNGGGSVNGDMSCTTGTTCDPAPFDQNAIVNLIATPDADSVFNGWTGACTVIGNSCFITMSDARTVAAYFSAVAQTKIVGGASYSQLSAAYAAAANGAVIQARAVEFNDGDLILNRGVTVTISGGYDAAFSSSDGQTAVKGKVLVRNGRINVDSVVVR